MKIAIAGRMASGKTTMANWLVDQQDYHKVSLAAKVKEIAHEIVSEKRLNEIFYDEKRWERFYPDILNIYDEGTIVKIQDQGSFNPYIGFLRRQIIKGKPELTLLTTKRERLWEGIENAKYWKLKDALDTSTIERSFLNFINSKLKKLK